MSNLSPAAGAAADAAVTLADYLNREVSVIEMVAAALGALANHQRKEWNPQLGPADHWQPTSHTRRELRNIADELFQAERYLAGPVNLKEQALKILSQETWSEEERIRGGVLGSRRTTCGGGEITLAQWEAMRTPFIEGRTQRGTGSNPTTPKPEISPRGQWHGGYQPRPSRPGANPPPSSP
jgi:hypothetical protein